MAIPKKVVQRFSKSLKKYRPILRQALKKDVNEADTVAIVKGLLAEVFGWDPYFEVTAEVAIRGTFVDIAIVTDKHVHYLIEVKAIGQNLSENHLRQAVNYGANEGIDWVVLTNGIIWQAHKIKFGKPISSDLVFEVDLLSQSMRDEALKNSLFTLTKEGMGKEEIVAFYGQKQAMSRFNVAAAIQSEGVLKKVRVLLKKAFPELKATTSDIATVIEEEIMKREVLEGERASSAKRALSRSMSKKPK